MFENSFKRLNFMKKNQACYASKNAQLKKAAKTLQNTGLKLFRLLSDVIV